MRALLVVLLSSTSILAHAASGFVFSAPPGPHAVGLRVVQQYDYSRAGKGAYDAVTGQPTSGEMARPVQTLVWYPAQASSAPRIKLNDYLRTTATEVKFDQPETEIAAAAARMARQWSGDRAEPELQQQLVRTMLPVRDAAPAAGKFPVVIYAPSFGNLAADNPDLCEYLASQGYIVIATAGMGAQSRTMTLDQQGVEAQAADISFLVGYASSLPQADTSKLAVAGYSWGGMANLFAAARDSRIKALVSLDGSLRYYSDIVTGAKYVTPAQTAVPMLYLAGRPPSLEDITRFKLGGAHSVLNSMVYGDVFIVTMPLMEHVHYGAMSNHLRPDHSFTDVTQAEVSQAYSWSAQFVLQFLNAYLKGDAAAHTFLNNPPAKNGMPARMASVDARRATGPAPTRESMAADLAKRGFEHAHDAYLSVRKRDPAFTLSEGDLRAWGKALLDRGNGKAAVEIIKLGTVLYPDNAHAFTNLGAGYEETKQKPLAIAAYKRAVALNPDHPYATVRLKALTAQ